MSKSFDAITLQASTDASITTDEQIGARHGDGAMRGMAPHRLGVSLLLILLPRLAVPLLKVLPAGAVFDSSKEEADGHHCVLPTRCASARHGRTGCRAAGSGAARVDRKGPGVLYCRRLFTRPTEVGSGFSVTGEHL